MSPAVVDRRRANTFAQQLNETDSRKNRFDDNPPSTHRGGSQALLRTVDLLEAPGTLTAPGPSADFAAALRQRLLKESAALNVSAAPAASAEAASDAGCSPDQVPTQRGTGRGEGRTPASAPVRWRRRAAIAGACVLVGGGGLGGVAVASQNSVPGDLTYGVKRTVESIQMSFAGSDRERGDRYLQQARTRLGEAETLLDRSHGASPDKDTVRHLRQVLQDMHSEADHGRTLLTGSARGGNTGPLRDLADFAHSGAELMDRITPRIPVEVAPERDLVWDLLEQIHEQVAPVTGAAPLPAHGRHDSGDAPDSATAPTPHSAVPGRAPHDVQPQAPTVAGTSAPGPSPTVTHHPADASRPDTPALLPELTIPLLPKVSTSPSAGTGSRTPGATSDTSDTTPRDGTTDTNPSSPKLTVPPVLPGLPGIGISLGDATTDD